MIKSAHTHTHTSRRACVVRPEGQHGDGTRPYVVIDHRRVIAAVGRRAAAEAAAACARGHVRSSRGRCLYACGTRRGRARVARDVALASPRMHRPCGILNLNATPPPPSPLPRTVAPSSRRLLLLNVSRPIRATEPTTSSPAADLWRRGLGTSRGCRAMFRFGRTQNAVMAYGSARRTTDVFDETPF